MRLPNSYATCPAGGGSAAEDREYRAGTQGEGHYAPASFRWAGSGRKVHHLVFEAVNRRYRLSRPHRRINLARKVLLQHIQFGHR